MQDLSYNIKSHWEKDKKHKLINSTGVQNVTLEGIYQNAIC